MAESADAKALKATLSLVEKQFGKGAIMKLGDSQVDAIEGIPPFPTTAPNALGPAAGMRYGGARRLLSLPNDDTPSYRPGERVIDREAFDDTSDRVPRPGDRVRHQRYGIGIVERVDLGPDPKIVAHFDTWGRRTILARFLELG